MYQCETALERGQGTAFFDFVTAREVKSRPIDALLPEYLPEYREG